MSTSIACHTRPQRRTRRNREVLDRQEAERYERSTRWIEARNRAAELAEHVATVCATYALVPYARHMHFVHLQDPARWAKVYAADVRDGRFGNFRAVDAERTEVSVGNPHPLRAFEVVVEDRLAEIARSS